MANIEHVTAEFTNFASHRIALPLKILAIMRMIHA